MRALNHHCWCCCCCCCCCFCGRCYCLFCFCFVFVVFLILFLFLFSVPVIIFLIIAEITFLPTMLGGMPPVWRSAPPQGRTVAGAPLIRFPVFAPLFRLLCVLERDNREEKQRKIIISITRKELFFFSDQYLI